MGDKRYAGLAVILAILMVSVIIGCGASSISKATDISPDQAGPGQEPSALPEAYTPEKAILKLTSFFCDGKTHDTGCAWIHAFQQGSLPEIPPGKRLTTGQFLLVNDHALGLRENGFLVLWTKADGYRIHVRFFDPEPANEGEIRDAEMYVDRLKTGRELPDNQFSRFLNQVSEKVTLYPAEQLEDSYAFQGTERNRLKGTRQEVAYFVRQKDDRLYVLFVLYKKGGLFYGVGELPLPVPVQ